MWFLATAVILAASTATSLPLHQFLAVSRPLGQGVLVVEAWIPKPSLAVVPKVLSAGRYHYVLIVGTQAQATRQSSAAEAAAELERFGCDANRIVAITVPVQATREYHTVRVWPFSASGVTFELSRRTYANGVAVREWLQTSARTVRDVDVFTLGGHARKSWLLVRYAMGREYRVGIIAAPELSNDPRYWLVETGWNLRGYLYAKIWMLFNESAAATTHAKLEKQSTTPGRPALDRASGPRDQTVSGIAHRVQTITPISAITQRDKCRFACFSLVLPPRRSEGGIG